MSQDAFTQFVPDLKPGGMVLWNELVQLQTVSRAPGASASRPRAFAEELGRRLVLNIVMVGFFAAVTGVCQPGIVAQGGGATRCRRDVQRAEPARLRQRL